MDRSYYVNIEEHVISTDEIGIADDDDTGLPVPYFVDKTNDQVLLDAEITRYVAEMMAEKGSDCWNTLSVYDLLPDRYKDSAKRFEKGTAKFNLDFIKATSWHFLQTRA